jgi:hypothetical protein
MRNLTEFIKEKDNIDRDCATNVMDLVELAVAIQGSLDELNKNKTLLKDAFEAGCEYQEYKSNVNLEEKSWEYTFEKWCEKNNITLT